MAADRPRGMKRRLTRVRMAAGKFAARIVHRSGCEDAGERFAAHNHPAISGVADPATRENR